MLRTKFFILLGLLAVLPVMMKAEAQLQKVSVELKNVSVVRLIKELKRQTGLDFLYNVDEVTRNGNISVSAVNEAVEDVLARSLGEKGLGFSVVNDVIVIKPVPQEETMAQQEEEMTLIKGVVKDEGGEPLPGVTVMIAGTTVGVTTNANGEFTLAKPASMDAVKLVFSFVGMKAQTLEWKGTDMQVVMEEDVYSLETVNVVKTGYQNIDKRHLTSAVTSVKAADVLVPGMTSIDQALEGRIPELALMMNSGEVGATPRIRVRGTSTLVGNREPLWVLDGFILRDPVNVSNEDLNNPDYINIIGNAIAGINPQDIERIDVLKDAAATALYGTRAANGVIVVTTKRGAIGAPRFSYYHTSKVTRRPRYTDKAINLMNSQERVQFGKDLADIHYNFPANMPLVGYEGALYRLQTGQLDFAGFQEEVKRNETVNTDWFDLLTRDAYAQDHTLTVSGGTDNLRYYVSAAYNRENGVSRSTYSERYTTMANMDITFNEKLDMYFKLNATVQKRNNLADQLNLMDYAYNTTRALPAYNPDGTLYYYDRSGYGGLNRSSNLFSFNILNEIENSYNKYNGNTVTATLDLRYNVIEGLELEVAGDYSRSSTLQEKWWGEKSHYVTRLRNAEYGDTPPVGIEGYCYLPYGGMLTTISTINEGYTFRLQANYTKFFGEDNKHMITALGGFEMVGSNSYSITDNTRGFQRDRGLKYTVGLANIDDYPYYKAWLNGLDMDAQGNTSNSPNRTIANGISHQMSGYLTFSYSFNNHIILNANARVDASNKFGDKSNDKMLPVWSFSGRWNTKENLTKSVDWINDLSFRASLGIQGNMLDSESPNTILEQQPYDQLYEQNVSVISRYPNPNLRWEKTRTWDLGLEGTLFNYRMMFELSYYYKMTKDAFTTVQVSSVNGVPGNSYMMNGGDIRNSGGSVYISGSPIQTKDWEWRLSTNYSINFNEVTSGTVQRYTYTDYLTGNAIVDGEAVSTFYSYKFLGLDPVSGAPRFRDYEERQHLLANKEIEDVVKMVMVKSGQRDPKFTGNFSTSLRYKKWSLSANFSYSLGAKNRLFKMYGPIMSGVSAENNIRKEFINRWQTPGDELLTNVPVIMSESNEYYYRYSEHFSNNATSYNIVKFATSVWDMYDYSDIRVVKANYLKCSSLAMYYNFDEKLLKKTPFSNAMLGLSALNLFNWTSKEMKGQDPSQAGFAEPNLSVRPSYSFTLSVTF